MTEIGLDWQLDPDLHARGCRVQVHEPVIDAIDLAMTGPISQLAKGVGMSGLKSLFGGSSSAPEDTSGAGGAGGGGGS